MPKKDQKKNKKSQNSGMVNNSNLPEENLSNIGEIPGNKDQNSSRNSDASIQSFVNNIGDISAGEDEKNSSYYSSFMEDLSHYSGNEASSDFNLFENNKGKKKEHKIVGKGNLNVSASDEEPGEDEFLQVGDQNNLSFGDEELPQNLQNAGQNQNNKFVPKQIPRTKWSTSAQINNGFWRGVGKTIGKASVLPATLVGKGLHITGAIKNEAYEKAENGQQRRNHSLIPGRFGEKFDSDKNTGADILEDFRRVPTVWSQITAGKAVDKDGKDLDPKVTVYVYQPKAGSSRTLNYQRCGHTMIGIEYTRHNKITGKPERYNLQYGFYPAGGSALTVAGAAMLMKGAVIPGQLKDDSRHIYDISKTYPAKKRQIEDIVKASEKYTEEGGYGYYTRNCTTFVRDMFKAGHIASDATINKIFPEEKVRFNSLGNTALVFTEAWNGFWDTDQQRKMGDLTQSNDRSYQGWGNKRVTKEDFDRYKATKNTIGFGAKGVAPASAGENMRRMTDGKGQLGSFNYNKELKNSKLKDLHNAIKDEGKKLHDKICEIMTPEQREAAGAKFCYWLDNLPKLGSQIEVLQSSSEVAFITLPQIKRKNARFSDLVRPGELKLAYASISDEAAEISRVYQKQLGSDSRINKEVMNLLSTMHVALHSFNETYDEMEKSSGTEEFGNIREKMSHENYAIKVGDVRTLMAPTHYESYLQIYKTPEAAVKAYKRYLELKNEMKQNENNNKSSSKKKSSSNNEEFRRLERNEYLASELDQSHRDMLNKNAFTQSDIDYAFRLRRMEVSGRTKAEGSMYTTKNTASMTYIALFFDKMFHGIQTTAKGDANAEGLPEGQDEAVAAGWLNDYLTKKTQSKMMGMTMILRGMLRAYDQPRADHIKEAFRYFLLNAYLRKVFPRKSEGDKMIFFGRNIDGIYAKVFDNPQMTFTKTIDNLVNIVLKENEATVQLDEMIKNAGKMKKR